VEIPNNPGCYIYKNKQGKIIYVGKAKNLKKRVASYFNKNDLDEKTKHLVSNISKIDFIVTNSEVEALILENNLIKKNQPKYNINLKDSKRYAYIKITDEDFPRALIARNITKDGKYFGPFVSAAARDYVLDFVKKTFRLRTCKRMPKKECLRYHIKLCDGPCTNKISFKEYMGRINDVQVLLKGNLSGLVKILNVKMKEYSVKKSFEKAIIVREQINALKYLKEKQNMERQKKFDEDIINYYLRDGKVYVMMFNTSKGVLGEKQEWVFDYIEGFFEDFLIQYYDLNKRKKELILPENVDLALKKYLDDRQVKVVVPKKGERKKLIDLVKKNIEIAFFANTKKIEELQKRLKLNDIPNVIECFDISHLSGTSTVGSMVQFRNGIPDKSNYRRFKIRTVKGIDDFASINEIVYRRYKRLQQEAQSMPNLIIIDGGKGQLSFAQKALSRLNLKIPIISIAKKFEEVHVLGLPFPLKIPRKNSALLFLQEIRDEAHRFAINYNRMLRKIK
jgi:excinuclease ABC subunit C